MIQAGENNSNARLTVTDVTEIKRRLYNGEDHTTIAKDFGVDRSHIGLINRDQRWSNIPWPKKRRTNLTGVGPND